MRTFGEDSGLTFSWPERERFPLILFGCVLLSLFAHAATFFVFQVVYPQRVTIPPPPPQVSLLTPSSPENKALLRWINAEDPALVASARSVVPKDLLAVPYRSSFDTVRTVPLGSTEAPTPVRYPPARNPLSVVASALPHPAADTGGTLPMRTTLELSTGLAERGLKPPAFRWNQRSTQPLEVLQALIGVNERGEVSFSFLQHSSGDPTIDTEALRQLGQLAFTPAEAPMTWAMAILDFGAEAYLTAPAELRQRAVK